MKYVATALFWLTFLATAPLTLAVGLSLWLATRWFDRDRRAMHAFICRFTFPYLTALPTWSVEVRGLERLPDGPAVLVANHQSMADVLAAMGLRHPFKYVSKASLFRLPAVGWMMRCAQYVELERGDLASTQRMMERCRHWVRRRIPVLLFPEGTYRPGEQLLPFRRGAFVLAIEEQVPLVPIAVEGTRELIDGDGPWMNLRARVRVTVLPPVPPAELGDDPHALARRVRAQLEEALR